MALPDFIVQTPISVTEVSRYPAGSLGLNGILSAHDFVVTTHAK